MKGGRPWRGGSREVFWRRVIESFRPERDRVRTHCERHGISTASFYRWRRILGLTGAGPGRREAFVQLEVVDGPSSPRGDAPLVAGRLTPMRMEVVVGPERAVRLSDDFNAQALLRLLPLLEA